MEIHVSDDPASEAASWLARRLRDAARRRGEVTIALSGGTTAPSLFAALVEREVPWHTVGVWQVDERVAPDGDSQRNAPQLAVLPIRPRLMPVTARDLRAGARRYGASLPERFDVVHLGLGDDGHTASWPPGSEVASSRRAVEVTAEFHGIRRMTLTARVVNAARSRVVLATGTAKADAVQGWLQRDPGLPITRVRSSGTRVFLDGDAAHRLPR
jgi:6-phosphogluconolactonase/glucosamine-6-phosphate isomerase/deaminase